MHITILALGSRGDVQPFAALGAGLRKAGYGVRVATFENFGPFIEKHGLEFHPIRGDARQILHSSLGRRISGAGRNVIRFVRGLTKTFDTSIDDYIEGFSADALTETDAIINQIPGGLIGMDLAEKLGLPHIVASVVPLTPTSAFPLVLMGTRSLGGPLNRLTYTLVERLGWAGFRRGIQRFRRNIGLGPISYGEIQDRRRHHPVLYGFSRHLLPPPRDWGTNVHVTGYWTLEAPDFVPPAALIDFLEAGEPPVFVGFGSMPVDDPQAVTGMVADALRLAGKRGIVSSGWANLGNTPLPDFIHVVDDVPHAWLFPRMSAIVHHGGAGTTASALRSGVPSIPVSFTADQHYWGQRIHDLGVAPAWIPFHKLTAQKLAAALRSIDDSMRDKAAALGAKLRAEDGVATAIDVIESYLRSSSR
jgi:UDP:flavonoid glycosyltransferase YjiC (YdhE family)